MQKITKEDNYDVIIVGGGNTALLTAIRAQEVGAEKILILEKAPKTERGGNGYFTTGLYRVVHSGTKELAELMPTMTEEEREMEFAPYTADEFFSDYMIGNDGLGDESMMQMIVEESNAAIRWMIKNGIEFETGSGSMMRVGGKLVHVGRLAVQCKGAGAGLSDTLYKMIEKKGIELHYETAARKLLTDDTGRIMGVKIQGNKAVQEVKSKSVVLACGGFESSPSMRAQYLGKDWDLCLVRGGRHNTGDGLNMAMDVGAQPYGNWSGCHAIFIDAESPQPARREDGEKTSKRIYIFGLVVNSRGERFVDEGEDDITMTYSRYGQHALKQAGRIAFQIFDSTGNDIINAMPVDDYVGAPYTKADTITELADMLAIDEETLVKTVEDYNNAIEPGGSLEYHKFLGLPHDQQALSITPPKSGNAFALNKPPYYAYAVSCGITFTYGGLKVSKRGEVLNQLDKPIPGLYAAGETVGGLFYTNYPGATGLTAGAIFAKIVGANAIEDNK
ncbi:FAD-dependent tricarballylate dehydrogenase TcuA [bacterium]|nr:FAD-dependent tricarballylate dehydrogenase TcuA [bacterium]